MKKRLRERVTKVDDSPITSVLTHHAKDFIASQSQQLHPMQKLQQTIGNRAVVRHLQKKNRIQRESETGVADPSARGQFVLGVSGWFNANKSASEAKVFVLIDEVARQAIAQLTALGIPAPNIVLDPQAPGKLDGQFRAKNEWSLLLNPNMACPMETSLSALTNTQLLHIVNVVYHEVRHAQQYYAMARFLAGTGVSASEIAQQMNIPAHVAQSAHGNPLVAMETEGIPGFGGSMTTNLPEYTETWAWYRQVYGKLGKYTQGIYDMLQDIWKFRGHLRTFLADNSQASEVSFIGDIVTKWKDETLPNVLLDYKTRLEGNTFFQMDREALAQINTILPILQNLIAKWDANEDMEVFKGEIDSLNTAVEKAYEELYTEKDAHVLGDQVAEDFKSIAGI